MTRAGKKGKSVTCVDGMDVGTAEEARELVKKFKRVLGVGGAAAANGSLQFQGDNAAVLCEMLVAMGQTHQADGRGGGEEKVTSSGGRGRRPEEAVVEEPLRLQQTRRIVKLQQSTTRTLWLWLAVVRTSPNAG